MIGANVNITRCIEIFEYMADNFSGYQYLREVKNHWMEVASVSVRNVSIP